MDSGTSSPSHDSPNKGSTSELANVKNKNTCISILTKINRNWIDQYEKVKGFLQSWTIFLACFSRRYNLILVQYPTRDGKASIKLHILSLLSNIIELH